jgi:hypothetical protein
MWGFSSKELIAKSPLTFIADSFPHFLLELVLLFEAVIGFPLLVDSITWHTATN